MSCRDVIKGCRCNWAKDGSYTPPKLVEPKVFPS
jgi:hypothetical protein